MSASLEGLGTHVFRGAIAAPYLAKQGLPPNTLESGDWAKDSRADKVSLSFCPMMNFSSILPRLHKLF